MKKIVLTMALLAGGLYLQAQQVRFGIRGGANLSSLGEYEHVLLANEDAQLEYKVGFHAGVFSQIYINQKWGLETGLYFTQLGGRDQDRDFDEDYKLNATANYLQLPVSVFREIQLSDKVKLFPSVGIYAGYGLSGKIKATGQIQNIDIAQQQDYFNDFAKRFDFGGTAGVQVGLGNLLLGAGYDQGVLRVNKQKANWDDNAYNSNFKLTVGYLF
ncbi:porin family protein [Sphingobacterium bambusae]|uniref:Porin family protein n=1 Tax=Sphingobacterium bambusae TaxID=662858 RepID=A0ABW6BCZ0_9SPHI|nr:porin family protein [Sphingobacterium bambusae]WPL48625.1 porin family protein [Sphingobacterium bambusae]